MPQAFHLPLERGAADWVWAGPRTAPPPSVWYTPYTPRRADCPPRQCQVISGDEAGGCVYRNAADGTLCDDGYYFEYGGMSQDVCEDGVCRGRQTWRSSPGMCVDGQNEHLPYVYKWDTPEGECRARCAASRWCRAFAIRASRCALFVTLAAGDAPAYPPGFARMGLAPGAVVGALRDPHEAAECHILSTGLQLVKDEYAVPVVHVAWSPSGQRYVAHFRSADGRPAVRVFALPLLREEPGYAGLEAAHLGPHRAPPGCAQCTAWLAAYAAPAAIDIARRTDDYEFLGPGRCASAALPAIAAVAVDDARACLVACSEARDCIGYAVSTCGAATECQLYAAEHGPITHADGDACHVCALKTAPDPLRPLGPGRCAGPRGGLPQSTLYRGVPFHNCSAACLADAACIGVTASRGASATAATVADGVCYLHFSAAPVARAPWVSQGVFVGPGAISHSVEDAPGLACYWIPAQDPLQTFERVSNPTAFGPPPAPSRPLQSAPVALHTCRALCVTTTACEAWQYLDGCAARDRTCLLHGSRLDPAALPPPFAFHAVDPAPAPRQCRASAARRRASTRRRALTTIRLNQTCGPLVRDGDRGEAAYAAGFGPGQGSPLSYTVLGDQIRLFGHVSVTNASGSFATPGRALAALPPDYAPHRRLRVAGTLSDGAVLPLEIRPDGAIVLAAAAPSAARSALLRHPAHYAPAACFRHMSGRTLGLRFSPDEQFVTVLSLVATSLAADHQATLWSLAGPEPRQLRRWSMAPWTALADSDVSTSGATEATVLDRAVQFFPDSRFFLLMTSASAWAIVRSADGHSAVRRVPCGPSLVLADISPGLFVFCRSPYASMTWKVIEGEGAQLTLQLVWDPKTEMTSTFSYHFAVMIQRGLPFPTMGEIETLPSDMAVYRPIKATSPSPDGRFMLLVSQASNKTTLCLYDIVRKALVRKDWVAWSRWPGLGVPGIEWAGDSPPGKLLLYDSNRGLLILMVCRDVCMYVCRSVCMWVRMYAMCM